MPAVPASNRRSPRSHMPPPAIQLFPPLDQAGVSLTVSSKPSTTRREQSWALQISDQRNPNALRPPSPLEVSGQGRERRKVEKTWVSVRQISQQPKNHTHARGMGARTQHEPDEGSFLVTLCSEAVRSLTKGHPAGQPGEPPSVPSGSWH